MDNDESVYRRETEHLIKRCQNNHLTLNINKDPNVDFRKENQRIHEPIFIDRLVAERVPKHAYRCLGSTCRSNYKKLITETVCLQILY